MVVDLYLYFVSEMRKSFLEMIHQINSSPDTCIYPNVLQFHLSTINRCIITIVDRCGHR